MKFTTLIPTYLNNGSPVGEETMTAIMNELFETFGGYSIEGTVTGEWADGDDRYRDECLKVTIVCDNNQLPVAESAVRHIGSTLDQKAMYFEVRDFDGVRFLTID